MGYTYVMSDIHGMGALLEKMLEKLSFSEEDVLYILGDMIDGDLTRRRCWTLRPPAAISFPCGGTMRMSSSDGMTMR